ncbi:hypothetical protein FQN54_002931 [Arachnomyces sp. PD_36]|nr:hypothetical protein FQN54_002931 [Arachnomyces sp. PD_36]
MRPSLRLLAKVKPSKYLEPFAPTGLAGLPTHPSPRPTLIFLYQSTLEKLKSFPESSVYRTSTEAVTKHRLNIVESTRPPGYDAWLERVKKAIAEDPERFKGAQRPDGSYAAFQEKEIEGRGALEWDGEPFDPKTEGPYRDEKEMEQLEREIFKDMDRAEKQDMHWEAEPALEASQVSEIEHKIGAGLIEEVIQVAEGELKLLDEMSKSEVWDGLTEKPRPGQWSYFERGEKNA